MTYISGPGEKGLSLQNQLQPRIMMTSTDAEASHTVCANLSDSSCNFPNCKYTPIAMTEKTEQPVTPLNEGKTRWERFVMEQMADIKSYELYRGTLAEFLGVTLLVMYILGFGLYREDEVAHDKVFLVLAIVALVTAVVAALLTVSGAHINPAITFAVLATRKCTVIKALLYVCGQVVGGILGVLILRALSAPSSIHLIAAPKPRPEITEFQAFNAEMIITGFLAFVALSVLDAKRTDNWGSLSLVLGLTIGANFCFAMDISGACMHPCFSIGPSVVNGDWRFQWIYIFGPIIGAVVGALFYEMVFSIDATEKFNARFRKKEQIPSAESVRTPDENVNMNTIKNISSRTKLCDVTAC